MVVVDLPALLFVGLIVGTANEDSKKARRFAIILAIVYLFILRNNFLLLFER
jgi:hypothetical protein